MRASSSRTAACLSLLAAVGIGGPAAAQFGQRGVIQGMSDAVDMCLDAFAKNDASAIKALPRADYPPGSTHPWGALADGDVAMTIGHQEQGGVRSAVCLARTVIAQDSALRLDLTTWGRRKMREITAEVDLVRSLETHEELSVWCDPDSGIFSVAIAPWPAGRTNPVAVYVSWQPISQQLDQVQAAAYCSQLE